MTKHLKLFNTQSEYTQSNPQSNMMIPVVYYIKDNRQAIYDNVSKPVVIATCTGNSSYKCIIDGEIVSFIGMTYDGTITYLPETSWFLNRSVDTKFKIYVGFGTFYPDLQGGRYYYYFNQQGPSTHTHMGQQKPVTWTSYEYKIIEPVLYNR